MLKKQVRCAIANLVCVQMINSLLDIPLTHLEPLVLASLSLPLLMVSAGPGQQVESQIILENLPLLLKYLFAVGMLLQPPTRMSN